MKQLRHALAPGLLCCTLAFTTPAGAAPPQAPLGTVFYSPAQRQAISQARRPAAPGQAGALAADEVRFDGLVRSSGGLAKAFLNGREADAPKLQGSLVHLPEGTRLAVGQTAVPGAGTADLVPAGSVGRGLPAQAREANAPAGLRLQRSGAPAPRQ